jgi:peptidoglycan/LPS O-acetylase OafA/YrhL
MVVSPSEKWMGGMAHTWSLAVEFQFYVGWAVALAALARARRPNFNLLLGLAVTIALSSALWRGVGWLGDANLNRPYAGTDTRLDALFLGAAAALFRLRRLTQISPGHPSETNPWLVRSVECSLILVVAWLIGKTLERNSALYFSGFAIVGTATSAIILTALLSPASLLGRPLQNRFLVWLGQLSYSLYLWHLPVGKFVKSERLAQLGLAAWATEGVRLLLCIVVAAGSYYGVERWFLRLKDRQRNESAVAPA